MGRRKQPITVYLLPDDPVYLHLKRFRDQSAAAGELMRIGLAASQSHVVTVTESLGLSGQQTVLTVTAGPAPKPLAPVTTTTPAKPTHGNPEVTVTLNDLSPEWE